MEKFWKWLMKTDARGLFVFSLIILTAVTVWRAIGIVKAEKLRNKPVTEIVDASAPDLSEFKPIGVIGFVSNQFAPETLVIPVNPFHPTFEAIVKSLVANSKSGIIELVVDGVPTEVHFSGNKLVDKDGKVIAAPFQKDMSKPGEPKKPQGMVIKLPTELKGQSGGATFSPATGQLVQPSPRPRISFAGMMQRPDGKFAAYISDSLAQKGRFVAVGDRVYNSTVTASDRDGVELQLDNGETVKLVIGGKPWVVSNAGGDK